MTIGSKTQFPLSLPVIDFSSRDLKPATPEWDSVRARVRKALEEYGCFEAMFDGASVELRKAVFKASEDVFNLPLETKLSTKSDKLIYKGYLTIPTMPLYEGMGFYGVDSPEVVDELTHKLWPQGNITFSTLEWDSVRAQVRKALEDFGCFEAMFDGASAELRKALFVASEGVFDLPLETKLSAKTDTIYKGYSDTIPSIPLYEGMGFDGVDNPEVFDELTHKLWPQGNITFSKSVQSFAEKLIELDVKVRTMIMESFGLEKYIDEHLNSAKNHFRLLKYRGLDENTEEKQLGLDPRIDRHFLTILCQNNVVDGLEIKTKDGEEWIKAKPSQDSSFLVIAGASLHVLLNGGVFPPLHHVVITGKKDRHVAGLFLLPKEGLIINAPQEIVDDEHPRLYKPFDYEAYLNFSYTDTKKRDLPAFKTYCSLYR